MIGTSLLPDGFSISGWEGVLLLITIIWSLIWKGLALWKAAQKNAKIWFIILLLINSVGILDIIYFYLVDGKKKESKKQTNQTS